MDNFQTILNNLEAEGNLRSLANLTVRQKYILTANKQYINLSSNDYLSLSDISLQKEFLSKVDFSCEFLMSNPSSRLMTGNSYHYEQLEDTIAKLYNRESAIVLSSGYLLNNGVLPAITTTKDLIIADKLVHASIIDALRLSSCRYTRFRHNDMLHLAEILEKEHKDYENIYIVTESVFSMDGDIAPIDKLVELKERYGAKIYLDEAHAFGVRGEKGRGVAEEMGLMDKIDYIVCTMGKAAASSGAFLVCDSVTKKLLVNKMRTIIFSTALPPLSLLWSKFVIQRLPNMKNEREHLKEISTIVHGAIKNNISSSNIIPIIVGENEKALKLSQHLKNNGYWATAIRYPTVAVGSARVRLSLCSALSAEEVTEFSKLICNI